MFHPRTRPAVAPPDTYDAYDAYDTDTDTDTEEPDEPTPTSPPPGAHLVAVVRRTLAPVGRAATPQTRLFHTVYAVTTLPLVVALHVALWALSTPGLLVVTVLALYTLHRTGTFTPLPTR